MATTGNDTITGDANNDTLMGLAGNDIIYTLQGDDEVYGGLGDDTIGSGSGEDSVYGGAGNDAITNDGGNDVFYGGGGNDQMVMGDVVYGSAGSAYGGAGDDTFVVTKTETASVHGGAGLDTLILSWAELLSAGSVSITFGSGTATSTEGLLLDFSGMEQLRLLTGDGDDTVFGGMWDDYLSVAGGANRVNAMAGNDTVAYTITGDANTLNGGGGDDVLQAQSGTAPLYFIVNGSNGRVDDGSLSVISGFERYEARGGALNDIASLGTGDDTFRGGGGNDTGFGAGGDDLLMGHTGDDVLYGGTGRDTLYGGVGQDSLLGDDGNDVLHGGHGHDTLTGGAGADVFAFGYTTNGFDLITDFTSGEDHIRYSADLLGALSPGPGPLDPSELQIGGSATTPGVFVLTYDADTDISMLLWSDNGHGSFGLMKFSGNVSMVASDIILF